MPAVLSKAIGAGGGSTSWTSQKRNVVRIFNQGVKIHRVFACIMYNTVFVFIIVLYINIVVEFYM